MNKKNIKTFITWLAFLNLPPVLIWIPFCNMLAFLPYLFWINIPALWLGLAKLMGKSHFDIQEFGAMPLTPLSWILVASFWFVAAIIMTVITSLYAEMRDQKRKEKENASNKSLERDS
jgi:hypothetical protein